MEIAQNFASVRKGNWGKKRQGKSYICLEMTPVMVEAAKKRRYRALGRVPFDRFRTDSEVLFVGKREYFVKLILLRNFLIRLESRLS